MVLCYNSAYYEISKYLEDITSSVHLLIDKAMAKGIENKEMNYLEKIYLYCLLTQVEINDDNFFEQQNWDYFILNEGNESSDILKGIIEKGYISIQIPEDEAFFIKLKKLQDLYFLYEEYLDIYIKGEIENFSSLEFGTAFRLPEQFDTREDFIEWLYEEIINHKLNIDDCKSIEKFIINKRLHEVYVLFDSVKSKKNIPVKKNNALEFNLIRMLGKYNLREILAIFNLQAKFTTARLYELEKSDEVSAKFSKFYIFSNKISAYLDHLESNNTRPKFEVNLPEDWIYSEVEMFVNNYIIATNEKWDKFTTEEILELWVKSVGMHNEEGEV